MPVRLLLAALLLAAAATPVAAQPEPGARIDSLLAAAAPHGPGHAVRVLQDGRIVYDRSAGRADLEAGTPITSETPFYIASVGKTFTAAAVLLLAERGALGLDDSVRRHLPDLPAYAAPVTIRTMLTHTSGFVDHYDLLAGEPGGLTDEIVFALVAAQDSLLFPPGTAVHYSNAAYVLLARVVERVSGASYADFLRAHVFDPLGMRTASVRDAHHEPPPRRAVGYAREGDAWVEDDYRSYTTGAGGVYASVEDLTKWDRGLDGLLTDASRRLMWSVPALPPGRRTPYGMGWLVECAPRGPLAGLDYVAATGSLDGFRAFLQRFESPRLTVIALSNGGAWLPPFGIPDAFLSDVWTPVEQADC